MSKITMGNTETFSKDMSKSEQVVVLSKILDSKLNDEMKIYATHNFLLGWESKEKVEKFLDKFNEETRK